MSVSCTLNIAPHQQNFTFCMKPLGERRKEFHHGETFGHSFTWVGNCVKPHWDTNRFSPCNYAIKPYNEREVVGPLSLWNCAMKLCIERDIYFIPKFHILETRTVKLPIETGACETCISDMGHTVWKTCGRFRLVETIVWISRGPTPYCSSSIIKSFLCKMVWNGGPWPWVFATDNCHVRSPVLISIGSLDQFHRIQRTTEAEPWSAPETAAPSSQVNQELIA
jgi:hypothetical protein